MKNKNALENPKLQKNYNIHSTARPSYIEIVISLKKKMQSALSTLVVIIYYLYSKFKHKPSDLSYYVRKVLCT